MHNLAIIEFWRFFIIPISHFRSNFVSCPYRIVLRSLGLEVRLWILTEPLNCKILSKFLKPNHNHLEHLDSSSFWHKKKKFWVFIHVLPFTWSVFLSPSLFSSFLLVLLIHLSIDVICSAELPFLFCLLDSILYSPSIPSITLHYNCHLIIYLLFIILC